MLYFGCFNLIPYFSITNIVKQYGQHLKASTAMVRLRLYEVLAQLPPQSFESKFLVENG